MCDFGCFSQLTHIEWANKVTSLVLNVSSKATEILYHPGAMRETVQMY